MNARRLFFSIFLFAVVIFGSLTAIRLLDWGAIADGFDKFFYVFSSLLALYGIFLAFFFRDTDFVKEGSVASKSYDPKSDPELISLREDLEKSRDKPIVVEPPIVNPTKGFRSIAEDTSMYDDEDEPEPEPEPRPNRNIIKPPLQQEYNRKDDNEYSGVF